MADADAGQRRPDLAITGSVARRFLTATPVQDFYRSRPLPAGRALADPMARDAPPPGQECLRKRPADIQIGFLPSPETLGVLSRKGGSRA